MDGKRFMIFIGIVAPAFVILCQHAAMSTGQNQNSSCTTQLDSAYFTEVYNKFISCRDNVSNCSKNCNSTDNTPICGTLTYPNCQNSSVCFKNQCAYNILSNCVNMAENFSLTKVNCNEKYLNGCYCCQSMGISFMQMGVTSPPVFGPMCSVTLP